MSRAATATGSATQELDPHVAALHRAMPFTRLVDYGMNPADARALLDETANGVPWAESAGHLADERAGSSTASQRAGHLVTARLSARWATAAALFAQMAENLDTPLKSSLYQRYADSVARLAALSQPPLERVQAPFRHGSVRGWLNLPPAGRAAATVVVWGGLSGWGAAYFSLACALADRGVACLLAEGPGQGEPRMLDKLYLDEGVASGFAPFIDVVENDPRLGAGIGLCGNSFGGLFAAHLAAQDRRVGACVVNGAPSDPVLPPFRTSREQFAAALGTDDEAELNATLSKLRFDPDRQQITCPVLVLHGGRDALLPQARLQAAFAHAAGDRGELRVWPDGEHTLYNHAPERDAVVADWFADQLLPPDSSLTY
jgi:alpha-beta hydrolase superfamily lysophospholipase